MHLRHLGGGLGLVAMLSGCGTTYEVATLGPTDLAAVSERHVAIAAQGRALRTDEASVEMFLEVRERLEPVAEAFCRDETDPGTTCDFDIGVDVSRKEVNAYQTYIEGRPTLIFTPGFLREVGDDHELAFVMGHEAGHHIADHIGKKSTQRTAAGVGGAVLGGLLVVAMAAAGARPSSADIDALVGGGAAIGAAGGGAAYSQTYELEADMLGAYIAEAAGYDPERGSAVFPRIANADLPEPQSGQAAFWSTHPSSPERLAWAAKVADDIRTARARGDEPRPPRAKTLEERLRNSLGIQ